MYTLVNACTLMFSSRRTIESNSFGFIPWFQRICGVYPPSAAVAAAVRESDDTGEVFLVCVLRV